jgi:hypothetical protein
LPAEICERNPEVLGQCLDQVSLVEDPHLNQQPAKALAGALLLEKGFADLAGTCPTSEDEQFA